MKKARCEICGKAILIKVHGEDYVCNECEENMAIDKLRYKYLGDME